jgi:calcineurin-like phosphoesterase
MAYQTDVGMAGPFNSVIGVRPDQVIERFLKGVNVRFQVGGDTPVIQGMLVDLNESTGMAANVERIHEPVIEGDWT